MSAHPAALLLLDKQTLSLPADPHQVLHHPFLALSGSALSGLAGTPPSAATASAPSGHTGTPPSAAGTAAAVVDGGARREGASDSSTVLAAEAEVLQAGGVEAEAMRRAGAAVWWTAQIALKACRAAARRYGGPVRVCWFTLAMQVWGLSGCCRTWLDALVTSSHPLVYSISLCPPLPRPTAPLPTLTPSQVCRPSPTAAQGPAPAGSTHPSPNTAARRRQPACLSAGLGAAVAGGCWADAGCRSYRLGARGTAGKDGLEVWNQCSVRA